MNAKKRILEKKYSIEEIWEIKEKWLLRQKVEGHKEETLFGDCLGGPFRMG